MPKTPRFSPTPSPRVVQILVFPMVQLLDVAGPLQVFSSANQLAARRGEREPYALSVVAASAQAITTTAGLGILASPLPRRGTAIDTLVIAGGPGVHDAADNASLVRWIGAQAARARRVASVCTGAFLLGATGLLNGRSAATHWRMCADLAQRFPDVRVEADPIFVRDGPIWTSAGVTAGIDLALAMVEEDIGRTTALEVAQNLVVFLKRPGGQAQFSAALSMQGGDDRFEDLQHWMNRNLHKDLSLRVLARQAKMSERSFMRHYIAATGLTPARAVEKLRLDAASRLLTDTDMPIKRVAERCGFGAEETLRRCFARNLRTTPKAYRERFGS